jgi:enoyl-CoA hydratase/carnithine racemase
LEIARFGIPDRYLQEVIYTGRTYPPDEALARGLVDEVVPAERLLERAIEIARGFSAVPTETFALTKQHLRGPLLQRIGQRVDRDDDSVSKIWADPAILKKIEDFVAKTVKRGT